MHTNSLSAFQFVKPRLTDKQREVLRVYEIGVPLTDKQVADILQKPINEVCNRVGELLKKKEIVEVGSVIQNGRRARLCELPKNTLFPI